MEQPDISFYIATRQLLIRGSNPPGLPADAQVLIAFTEDKQTGVLISRSRYNNALYMLSIGQMQIVRKLIP